MNYGRQSITFQFEEDPFANTANGVGKIFPDVLLIMKFLQTKHQVKSMNMKF